MVTGAASPTSLAKMDHEGDPALSVDFGFLLRFLVFGVSSSTDSVISAAGSTPGDPDAEGSGDKGCSGVCSLMALLDLALVVFYAVSILLTGSTAGATYRLWWHVARLFE